MARVVGWSLLFLGVFAVGGVDGCSSEARTTAVAIEPIGCGAAAPECRSPGPDYQTAVVPILNAKCNTCHDGRDGGPWPLTTFEDVQHWRNLVLGDVVACSMPPVEAGATLSAAERGTLLAWLACVQAVE